MNNFLKKLFGINKIEDEMKQAFLEKEKALAEVAKAKTEAEVAKDLAKAAKAGAKELATAKKEPYVAVLETHVNDQNPRNGFFELDWNEYFVIQLRAEGYPGESDEEVVDKWFTELCRNVGSESGVSMDRRGSGYINVNNIGGGRTEVS